MFIPNTRVQIWVHVSHACVTEWSVCMFQTRISCQCWTRPPSRSSSPCRRSAPNVPSSSTSGEKHTDALQRYAHNIVLFLGHAFVSPRPTENLRTVHDSELEGQGFKLLELCTKHQGDALRPKQQEIINIKMLLRTWLIWKKSSF